MSIEAMKLALEALKYSTPIPQNKIAHETAITALRTAIEAAEKREPVAWMDPHGGVLLRLFTGLEKNTYTIPLYTTPPQRTEQPEQGPVLQDIEQYRLQMAGISTAAMGYWKEGDGIHTDYDTLALRDVAKLYAKYDELYKAQRKPLTDEQIDDLSRTMVKGSKSVNWLCRAIESKLKEKNT